MSIGLTRQYEGKVTWLARAKALKLYSSNLPVRPIFCYGKTTELIFAVILEHPLSRRQLPASKLKT